MMETQDNEKGKDYVINVQLLESTGDTKKHHDGLETYLAQEIFDILPELTKHRNILWSELKNIVAIRLMDKRDNYKDLEDCYSNLHMKYMLSVGLNVSISLCFFIKWLFK